MNENIYKIGQKLGITENEITTTLKSNKYTIVSGILIAIISIFASNTYFLGMHYIGISIRDFDCFIPLF